MILSQGGGGMEFLPTLTFFLAAGGSISRRHSESTPPRAGANPSLSQEGKVDTTEDPIIPNPEKKCSVGDGQSFNNIERRGPEGEDTSYGGKKGVSLSRRDVGGRKTLLYRRRNGGTLLAVEAGRKTFLHRPKRTFNISLAVKNDFRLEGRGGLDLVEDKGPKSDVANTRLELLRGGKGGRIV